MDYGEEEGESHSFLVQSKDEGGRESEEESENGREGEIEEGIDNLRK